MVEEGGSAVQACHLHHCVLRVLCTNAQRVKQEFKVPTVHAIYQFARHLFVKAQVRERNVWVCAMAFAAVMLTLSW